MTINMFENGQHVGPDNWDIGGVQVRLGTPLKGAAMACLIDASGNGGCDASQPSCNPSGVLGDTEDTGVARLSGDNNCMMCDSQHQPCTCGSGQGTTATFSTASEGCAAWNPGPPSQPFDTAEVVIDTGDQALNSGSTIVVAAFKQGTTTPEFTQTILPSTSFGFDKFTEHSATLFFTTVDGTPLPLADIDHFTMTATTNNEWHVWGLSIFGRNASGTGQDTCLYRLATQDGGLGVLLFGGNNPSVHTFVRGANCP